MDAQKHTKCDYLIFRRMSRSLIPGFGKKMVVAFIAGALIGIALFVLLGLFTINVTRVANYSDRNAELSHLTECLYAIKYEFGMEVNATDTEGKKICADMRERYLKGKSDEEISFLANEGKEAGLSSQTTTTGLSKYVSGSVSEQKPIIPVVWRIVIALFPAFGLAALFLEYNGATISGEIKQRIKNKKAVKLYVYRSDLL